ncbi:MAG: DNA primase [Candidatus Accumulibacter phosphatis]|nr:DNA primase [Candidatus Accumulibacter phosphatis]
MSNVDNLLQHLDKVKRTGSGTWTACCPAHDDRGPSLAVRELDDGRILVHCHAGCSVDEVLQAVGLTFSDLYPPRALDHPAKPERRPFPAADVLRAIAFEALVVCASAVAVLEGKPFNQQDRERLILAASRIQAAITAAGVSYG